MVKDAITNGSWDLQMLSVPLSPDIQNAIKATTLRRVSVREDQLSWISSINGEFDSRNAYLLAIGEDLSANDFHGKWVWKIKTLPKIQVFLWKFLHNSLPVKSILAHRGIEGLGGCAFCTDNEENILHVLRECPIVQEFWCLARCPPQAQPSFTGDLADWLHINAYCPHQATHKDYSWKCFFLFGIWNLWLQRNRKAFKQQEASPNLVWAVEIQVREFFYCMAN